MDLQQADVLWKSTDVATFLGVSRSWVYHAVERRELPHLRPCGLLRFDPSAIRAFAKGEAHKQKIVPLHPPKKDDAGAGV